jgi:hypothetical protein
MYNSKITAAVVCISKLRSKKESIRPRSKRSINIQASVTAIIVFNIAIEKLRIKT